MKILYCTTIGMTMMFFKSIVKQLIDDGHTVEVVTNANEYNVDPYFEQLGVIVHNIEWQRNPLSLCNIKAVKTLKKLICSKKYDIIHCHTPVASICTRIASNESRHFGTKVIYTAHGFHFYKGAPITNWIAYFPIEWICSFLTDVLITINKEDYQSAKRFLHAKTNVIIPGVGIDVKKFEGTQVNRVEKRKELGVPTDAYMILSVGELNKNKNHQMVINEIAKENDDNVHYVIVGKGPLRDDLFELSKKLNVSDRVHLVGYREDVAEIYKVADLYYLPSLREGLNVSLIEARASGLECKCLPIRGNVDVMDTDDINIFDVDNINNQVISIYEEEYVKKTGTTKC